MIIEVGLAFESFRSNLTNILQMLYSKYI